MRRIALCALASLAATAAACDDGMLDGEDPEDSVFVDDGKADDFFSVSAQEYLLEGNSTVVLDAAMASRPAAERLEAAT